MFLVVVTEWFVWPLRLLYVPHVVNMQMLPQLRCWPCYSQQQAHPLAGTMGGSAVVGRGGWVAVAVVSRSYAVGLV
jgi:hypothetical protein